MTQRQTIRQHLDAYTPSMPNIAVLLTLAFAMGCSAAPSSQSAPLKLTAFASVLAGINAIPSADRSGILSIGPLINLGSSEKPQPALMGTISFSNVAGGNEVQSDLIAMIVANSQAGSNPSGYSVHLLAQPTSTTDAPANKSLGLVLGSMVGKMMDYAYCNTPDLKPTSRNQRNTYPTLVATPPNSVVPSGSTSSLDPSSPANNIVLYRGIPESYDSYTLAQQGIAEPSNPDANKSMVGHAFHSSDSQWTSWSSDPLVSLSFANQERSGVVLKAAFPVDCVLKNSFNPTEKEYLISGTVEGASVIPTYKGYYNY